MNNWVDEVQMWNEDRDNLKYSPILEWKMLEEELNEYYDATTLVDQADALADILVVAVGGLYKLVGGDKQKFEDIMLAVTAANNLKSSTKNSDGKITKPKNFVGPEGMIRRILDEY